MPRTISKAKKRAMHNPFLQFFRFFYLNIKILNVVAAGHGGTRGKDYKMGS